MTPFNRVTINGALSRPYTAVNAIVLYPWLQPIMPIVREAKSLMD